MRPRSSTPGASLNRSGSRLVPRIVNPLRPRAPAAPHTTDTDERVLTELYLRHGTALMTFVRRLVEDPGRAEDVVQETMLRGWRNLDRIDPAQGDPRAYLFAVARNLVIDLWRADERRPRLVGDDATVAAQAIDDRADALVDAVVVEQALGRLTPEHRAVVDQLYYRGASVREAARNLGIRPGTVKSRSYYAIRALRAAFEEMGVER